MNYELVVYMLQLRKFRKALTAQQPATAGILGIRLRAVFLSVKLSSQGLCPCKLLQRNNSGRKVAS